MEKKIDLEPVERIIEKVGNREKYIITIFQEIQEHYHYIPKEVFPILAKRLHVGEARLYSVATFYENFSLEPKGKYVIKVCDGTACHVRKSTPILEKLLKELALSGAGATTEDGLFTLETVSCLGACGVAPVMLVNDKVYTEMTPDKAMNVLNSIREEERSDA